MNINNICNNYYSKDFNALEKDLSATDQRIAFEHWLTSSHPNQAKGIDLDWHTRVISLLCTKTGSDVRESSENRQLEDRLIARLISRTAPLGGSAVMKPDQVNHIYSKIKTAELPSICTVLLRRLLQFQDLGKIFQNAINENNLAMVKAINHAHPQEFSALLTKKGADGSTPVSTATTGPFLRLLKYMLEAAPEACDQAIGLKDKKGMTPLHYAVALNQSEMVQLMADRAPNGFKKALTIQNKIDQTPVQIAVTRNALEPLKIMLKAAPDAFDVALTLQDINGQTPVHNAAFSNQLAMLQLMAEGVPNGFKKTLTIEDDESRTPLHKAATVGNIEILHLMTRYAPEAQYKMNDEGETVFSILKKGRPLNYRTFTQHLKSDLEGMEFYKTWLARKELSHAFHLEGTTLFSKSMEKSPVASTSLTGHQSPQWFHLMEKHLPKFREHYPDLLSNDLIALMKHTFDSGANPTSYSLADKVERIKAGLPITLNTGFSRHAVSVLIWGDQFIVCNRGGSSRSPIEVYHFDPSQIDETILREIEQVGQGTEKVYEQLFFQKLPAKLRFSQNDLDRKLENSTPLPKQLVGNCSFVSATTAIYALILLSLVRGMDGSGHLKDVPGSWDLDEQIKNTILAYQLWLSNEQLHALEANILPLEKGQPSYVPDHRIIVEALRKAHLLPLDEYCQQKLEALSEVYLNSLDVQAQKQLKADMAFWNTLAKAPLL